MHARHIIMYAAAGAGEARVAGKARVACVGEAVCSIQAAMALPCRRPRPPSPLPKKPSSTIDI